MVAGLLALVLPAWAGIGPAGAQAGGAGAAARSAGVKAAAPANVITGNDQAQAFVSAVGTPNAVVRIAGNVDLDLSGLEYVHVAPGVQILGDRSADPRGPRLFTTTFPRVLLMVGDDGAGTTSDDVRISGIRLDGGQGTDSADSDTPDADGIKVSSSRNVEIDHNEIYGWRGAAVSVSDVQNHIDVDHAHTVWVHDNSIHHNQHVTGEIIGGGHGAGYGVETSYGAYAYIQRNVFNFNRHAITGDGRDGTGYFVYDNLILPDGGDNTEVIHTHIIDMHGRDDCGVSTYNCGPAGQTMKLYYNTVEYTAGTAVKLRGVPSDGMYAQGNVFAHEDVWGGTIGTGAFEQTVGDDGQYIHQSGNTFGLDTYDQAHKSCDFDGDGTPDQFLATGVTWWYASSRLAQRWVYLNRSPKLAPDVTLKDVNGDGRCDATAGGVVYGGGRNHDTSPAIAASPSGGWEIAFQANDGTLWTRSSAGGGPVPGHRTMAPDTSPSIVALPSGGYEIAYQTSDGVLGVISPSGEGSGLGLGMWPGTSPSIAVTPSGQWEIAIHADDGRLWTRTAAGGGPVPGQRAMAPGSSPSITALPTGGFEIAYQTSDGVLGVISPSGEGSGLGLGMAPGTSPSIAPAPSSAWDIALHTDDDETLWTRSSTGGGPVPGHRTMAPDTSPSIAALPSGGFETVYQTSDGVMGAVSPSGEATGLGLGMWPGTSPSIAVAPSGEWQVAFQANDGVLWRYSSTGSVERLGLGMA